MTNILLMCSGGMSTSMMANRMEDEARARGLEVRVWAVSEAAAAENVPDADVVLVGPQMRFKVPELQKKYPATSIAAIEMRDYGMMNGGAVLDAALKLIS